MTITAVIIRSRGAEGSIRGNQEIEFAVERIIMLMNGMNKVL